MAITTNSTTNTTTPSSTIKAESAAPPTSPPLVLPPWISSPTPPAPTNTNGAQVSGQPKCRDHRANITQRRATHNAVEWMRRETLDERFLMLPSLAALCRPSKAAIVSS
ncbi:hypothetical protein DFH08DRAFT_1080491 [Mycena albidolilacea]|uniref:Uncharacterized protein n=1 Tax=Mycena albidolilacea TaxID=1033008 RepID=A0AAD7A1H1_9AGAR|nr:hypothetical protein DFH08DRAFT_1080491 [Mycena albidolilacea]